MKGQLEPRWNRRTMLRTAGAGLAVAAGLALPRPQPAAAATQRPIADFLSAQGTTAVFFPPVADLLGWTTPFAGSPILLTNVDYAGHADTFLGGALGTTTSGKVTERPLGDGRAEVLVVLYTRNALSWVIDTDDFSFVNVKPLFGSNPLEVAAGAAVALGESHLQWKFVNSAPGATLPDLVPTFIFGEPPAGFEQISISFRASAGGPLREAFGEPEGTPGHLTVSQTCQGATVDGCPAELVEIRAVGR